MNNHNHAVIAGSLVDWRNYGVGKSLKITIHVPYEMATAVFNCFGYPNPGEPVPVVVARLGLDTDEPLGGDER